MVQIFLLILFLLLPVSSEAAYTIYLKNGSEISGVYSYEKKGGEVIIYFGGGSMGIPEKDIVKIESTEAPEKDFSKEEVTVPEAEKTAPSVPPVPAGEPAVSETADRASRLQADLDAINAELGIIEGNESTYKGCSGRKNEQQTELESVSVPLFTTRGRATPAGTLNDTAEKGRTPSAKGLYRRRDEISSIRCTPAVQIILKFRMHN